MLSVVLPALNEEEAVGSTIGRCLSARARILAAGVSAVEIIVVSDGSTDRTVKIATQFPNVAVLVFTKNRGYGAAIKAGFHFASGDLLAFLDADGTCDPIQLAPLCKAILQDTADVAIGFRMGPGSRMPWIRTVGNLFFASLLGALSRRRVRDVASGMRVLRRSAYEALLPLPDGLHFTPAMSAQIVLADKVRFVEIPMPYAERVGQSKLSVLRDGIRFLTTILRAALCYQPARPLVAFAVATLVAAGVLLVEPSHHYLTAGRVEDWMIYRVLLASLLLTSAGIAACTAVVADRIAAIANDRPPKNEGLTGRFAWLLRPAVRRAVGLGCSALAVLIVWPGITEYLGSGKVYMHWSRAALASMLVASTVILAASAVLLNAMELMQQRRTEPRISATPDQVHVAKPPLEAPR